MSNYLPTHSNVNLHEEIFVFKGREMPAGKRVGLVKGGKQQGRGVVSPSSPQISVPGTEMDSRQDIFPSAPRHRTAGLPGCFPCLYPAVTREPCSEPWNGIFCKRALQASRTQGNRVAQGCHECCSFLLSLLWNHTMDSAADDGAGGALPRPAQSTHSSREVPLVQEMAIAPPQASE